MKAKLFLMNDDYQHVVIAYSKEEAEKYFKREFEYLKDDVDDDYFSVNREINPNEQAVFEDVGEITFGDFVANIDEKKIPMIICWKE